VGEIDIRIGKRISGDKLISRGRIERRMAFTSLRCVTERGVECQLESDIGRKDRSKERKEKEKKHI